MTHEGSEIGDRNISANNNNVNNKNAYNSQVQSDAEPTMPHLDNKPQDDGLGVGVTGQQRPQLQHQESSDLSSLSSQQPIEANIVIKTPANTTAEGQAVQSTTSTGSPVPGSRAVAALSRQVSSPTSSQGSGLSARGDFFASSSPVMQRGRVGAGGKMLVRQPSSMIDTTGFSEDALEEINKSMHPFKDIHSDSFFRERVWYVT